MKKQKELSVLSFAPDRNEFIGKYQLLIKEKVLPYQYKVLNDQVEGAEKSHVITNFINAAKALRGENTDDGFYGMVFQDSDAAKWLEAAAFSLAVFPDAELEGLCDELIGIIAEAQDSDGYLNTFFTVKDREKRWSNIFEAHELYCSGHFMEAAVAYYDATSKDSLLRIMEKNVEHIYDIFIVGGHKGYPGHPEIELALLKMYDATKNEKCLELAKHFILTRGEDPFYYEKECQSRSWSVWGGNGKDHEYQQSMMPVKKQTDAVGHAVRAVYLYTAMADLAARTDDRELFDACKRLWHSITRKRMYITGAIGSTCHGEAFSKDFDLPGDTAYAETCASIGLMFFARQMLGNEIRGEYADVMERAFYNTVLASMELNGERFFYVNPLEVIPGISAKSPTHRHVLTQRPPWHNCACCPPNAARLISSFGSYAYGESESTAFCHLFAAGKVTFKSGVELVCKTSYPFDFTVRYEIIKGGSLAVRIPGWCKDFSLSSESGSLTYTEKDGYIYFTAVDSDTVTLSLDAKAKYIYADLKVPALSSMTAITRGPLVYCFEGTDNDGDILSLRLKNNGSIKEIPSECQLLGEYVTLEAEAMKGKCEDTLYSDKEPVFTDFTAKAIPYFMWGNSGETQMRVWMNKA